MLNQTETPLLPENNHESTSNVSTQRIHDNVTFYNNSVWTNSQNETEFWGTSDSVLYYAVNGFGITWGYFLTHLGLLCVSGTGIFLNIIALRIVLVNKSKFHDASHIFISNLAMSDIVNGVVFIYAVLYNLIHFKNYYECAFRIGLLSCVTVNSLMHLLCLIFDRYFKIMYPIKALRYFNDSKQLTVVSRCIWIIAGILAFLPVLGWRRPTDKGIAYCNFFGVMDRNYLILLISLCLALAAIMLYFYTSIVYVACKFRNRTATTAKNYDQKNARALWWGPAKTVVILVTLYCCCWLPTGVVILMHLADSFPDGYTEDHKGTLIAYVSSLICFKIIVNPLVYAFKIRRKIRNARTMVKRNLLVEKHSIASVTKTETTHISSGI